MSKNIDLTKKLSEEDKEWLRGRSRQHDIDENERILSDGKKTDEPDDVVFAPTPTVAAPPIEPGSPADTPPKFVGQRPYGVDRAVWGGSTGLSEQDAYKATAGEPHAEFSVEEVDPEDLTVEELKDELRDRDLPLDGNKPDLVKRLKKALKEEAK